MHDCTMIHHELTSSLILATSRLQNASLGIGINNQSPRQLSEIGMDELNRTVVRDCEH